MPISWEGPMLPLNNAEPTAKLMMQEIFNQVRGSPKIHRYDNTIKIAVKRVEVRLGPSSQLDELLK